MTDPAVSDSIDTVLRSDHAAIRRALSDLRVNSDPAGTRELLEQFIADIVRHDVAEEQYLLPAVRDQLADGAAISAAVFTEHEHIEHLLKSLDSDDTSEARIGAVLDDIAGALDEHIRTQESSVLPALVAASDPATLSRLGEGVLGAEQLAPTHPRSFVPKSATLSKITSWLTGLVEKSVDSREVRD